MGAINQAESDSRLNSILEEDEIDLASCTKDEKVTYLWQLYLQTEADLHTALRNIESLRQRHSEEMDEMEGYVAHIRSLSVEREALTLEVETENECLRSEIECLRSKVEKMPAFDVTALASTNVAIQTLLKENGFESIANKTVLEQTTHLVLDIAQQRAQMEALQKDFDAIKVDNSSDIAELLHENEQLTLEGEELRTSVATVSRVSDVRSTELLRAKEESRKLNGQLSMLASELADSRANCSSLRAEAQKLTVELANLVSKSEDAQLEMSKVYAQLRAETDGVREELSVSKKRLHDCREDLNVALAKLTKSAEKEMEDNRLVKCATEIEELKAKLATTEMSLKVSLQDYVILREQRQDELQFQLSCKAEIRAAEAASLCQQRLHEANMASAERVSLLEGAARQLEADNKKMALKLQDALTRCARSENMLKMEQSKTESLTALAELPSQAAAGDAVLELKSQLAQARLQHRLDTDTWAQQLHNVEAEARLRSDGLNAAYLDLKRIETEEAKLKVSFLTETRLRQQAEERCQHVELEMSKLWARLRDQMEQTNKLAIEKRDMEEQCSQLKAIATHNQSSLLSLSGSQMTDNSKFVELAQSRVESAERRISDLKISLEKMACSLAAAEDQAKELPGLRDDLRQRKDEVIRLRGQVHEEQLHRSLEAKSNEELSRQLAAGKNRDTKLQLQVHELQHSLLDAEAKMATATEESRTLNQKVDSCEQTVRSLLQQVTLNAQEIETLHLELLAAGKKLDLQLRKYSEKRSQHKAKLARARELFSRTKQSFSDKVVSLEAELKTGKLALCQEKERRQLMEIKYRVSVEEKQDLQSRSLEQDEELHEKRRNLALAQARANYLLSENSHLASKLRLQGIDNAAEQPITGSVARQHYTSDGHAMHEQRHVTAAPSAISTSGVGDSLHSWILASEDRHSTRLSKQAPGNSGSSSEADGDSDV